MSKKKMITGITPSGKMTLGNYLAVVKRMVEFQDEYNLNVFIANLHAIVSDIEPNQLNQNIREMAALYFACGLDANKSTIWLQSDVLEHAQLGWIINTRTYMGELSRMTQFKDKSSKSTSLSKENIPTGLFTYPTLMAADILIHDAHIVPVGVDQKQHIEITRDLAIRFNKKYKINFIIPEPLINKDNIKILDLQDPSKKMSKSSENEKAIIYVLDNPNTIAKKIKAAITDSENMIKYDPINKPGVSNLMNIYCIAKNITTKEAEAYWSGKNYKDLKDDVIDALVELLTPIQIAYNKLINSNQVEKWLELGAQKAREIASKKINSIQDKIGLNY